VQLIIKSARNIFIILCLFTLAGCGSFSVDSTAGLDEESKTLSQQDNLWASENRGKYTDVLKLLSTHINQYGKISGKKLPVYHFSFDQILNKSGNSLLPYDITNNLRHRFYNLKNSHIRISDISVDSLKRDVFVMKNIEQILKEANISSSRSARLSNINQPDTIVVGAITAADEDFASGSYRKRGDIDIGKGGGQSDSIYTSKTKKTFSRFVINLQAQTIPGREPLSSVEMAVILRKDEQTDGLSVTVMGNGLSYTNELYKNIGPQLSILSLLDIATFELVRKLYNIPPLISDKDAILSYYGDNFESQARADQVRTIQRYLNAISSMQAANKKKAHSLIVNGVVDEQTEARLQAFQHRFEKLIDMPADDLNMDDLAHRKKAFTSLVYIYSKITITGLKKTLALAQHQSN